MAKKNPAEIFNRIDMVNLKILDLLHLEFCIDKVADQSSTFRAHDAGVVKVNSPIETSPVIFKSCLPERRKRSRLDSEHHFRTIGIRKVIAENIS